MTRRFQFRLRTLLGLLVTVCLVLGGWHLYSVKFGPRVALVGHAEVGEPFTVRGRFVDFLGFETEVFVVNVSKLNAKGQRVIHQSSGDRATRRGLWNYAFEVELGRVTEAGDYDIEVWPLTKAAHARKKHIDRDCIRGKMTVTEPAAPAAK